MKRIHWIILALAASSLLLLPLGGYSSGTLSDISYKVKSTDGNRLESLFKGGGILRGHEASSRITFTFDDGPDHRTTPILLDQLDRYHVKATFFVNGARFHPKTAGSVENQAVLREIYKRGHFIGNHSFSHKDITTLDGDQWRSEILQVSQLVNNITGRRIRLFRPPFGRTDSVSLARLREDGYTVVMWNLDPMDWNATSTELLVDRTKSLIEENPSGGIFLLHDTNRNTAEAFPLIMEYIQSRNEELRRAGKPTLEVVGIDQYISSK